MTLDQNFQSDNERPVGSLAMASEPSAVSNKQGTTQESVTNSTDRKDNSVCVKCLQARSEGNLCAEDAVFNSTESFKPLTCRRIDNFLEKNKDENYYEEFMLPYKVLSKFALVLGKYVYCRLSVAAMPFTFSFSNRRCHVSIPSLPRLF